MRPIDADALMEWVYRERLDTRERIASLVERIPTIDPPQGEWEERIVECESPWLRRRFYCSNCGNWNSYGMTRYCPDCGAKMAVKK